MGALQLHFRVPGPVPTCHKHVLNNQMAALKPWIPIRLQQNQIHVNGLLAFKTLQNVIHTHPRASFSTMAKLSPPPKTILPASPGRPSVKATISQGSGPAPCGD